MRRTLLLLLVAASACGGSPKPTTQPPPLTDTKAEEPKPAPKPEPPPPPPPAPPLDLSVSPPKMTVKLVSPGKGKRTALKLTPKQGGKQQVEIALDLGEKQVLPAELGGTSEQRLPTIVLIGAAEVKAVDDKGKADYQFTVADTDARDAGDKPDPQTPMIKTALVSLKGMTISGSVDANGAQSDVKLHLDHADEAAHKASDIVRVALPWWPLLPTEPVGVGAKWQVTTSTKLVDKVDVTQTTDFELLAHKGDTWTIKGTTKVTAADQDLEGAKLTKFTGGGNTDVSVVDGALYPTFKGAVNTSFTGNGSAPDPKDHSKQITVAFTMEVSQGASVTAKQ